MHRTLTALTLGLSLLLVGCADNEPVPAGFPTSPDAPGTGKVDSLNPAAVDNTPADPESPKDLVVPDEKTPKSEEAAPVKDAEGNTVDTSVFDAEELEAIRQLPADQQALAIKQVSCPISDEHLGSMGKPVVQTVEGKTFFLCCKSCVKEVKADPKAALAKLPKK
jgi:hypothetical protein